jgi:hypothetical protein
MPIYNPPKVDNPSNVGTIVSGAGSILSAIPGMQPLGIGAQVMGGLIGMGEANKMRDQQDKLDMYNRNYQLGIQGQQMVKDEGRTQDLIEQTHGSSSGVKGSVTRMQSLLSPTNNISSAFEGDNANTGLYNNRLI